MEYINFEIEQKKELLTKLECDDEDNIKKCYHKLVLKIHPDKNKEKDTTKEFQDVQEAYSLLTDKDKLNNYIKDKWFRYQEMIINKDKVYNILKYFDITPKTDNYQKEFDTLLDNVIYLYNYKWTMSQKRWESLVTNYSSSFLSLWTIIHNSRMALDEVFFNRTTIQYDSFIDVYELVFELHCIEEMVYTNHQITEKEIEDSVMKLDNLYNKFIVYF